MIRTLRHEVPVDDQWHEFEFPILVSEIRLGCRDPRIVEFWADHGGDVTVVRRRFIVVGTGHPWPPLANRCVGTVIAPGGQLVWHLIEGLK